MGRDLLIALTAISAYFLLVAVANVVYLRRETLGAQARLGPFVSVIVTARDEKVAIERCLRSLLAQRYDPFEVILVDDGADGAIGTVAAPLAAADPRLRVVTAHPLPRGWLGKPHALCEGVAAARGDVLLLTDADSVHDPGSISWGVTNLEAHRADLLSGYLRQEYGSLGERLVAPTMYALMLLLPLPLVPATKSAGLAFSIGQYVLVRRTVLHRVGGLEAVADSIVEDVSLARRVKECGFRNVFLDASEAASCRPYRGFADAFHGVERSIYAAMGADPLWAAIAIAVVLGCIVAPPVWVLAALLRVEVPPVPAIAATALFALAWGAIVRDRRAPVVSLALYPVVFLDLTAILASSMATSGPGAGRPWKARAIDEQPQPEKAAADGVAGRLARWVRTR